MRRRFCMLKLLNEIELVNVSYIVCVSTRRHTSKRITRTEHTHVWASGTIVQCTYLRVEIFSWVENIDAIIFYRNLWSEFQSGKQCSVFTFNRRLKTIRSSRSRISPHNKNYVKLDATERRVAQQNPRWKFYARIVNNDCCPGQANQNGKLIYLL